MNDLQTRLTGLLDAAAIEHGYDLVLVEVAGSKRTPLVRVYLDHEGGITIDQIAAANRWIKEIVESQPECAVNYALEVSSPGIERPLVKPADFERFAGSEAKVSVTPAIEGRTHFTGTVLGMKDGDVLFDVAGTTMKIPHGAITRARLKIDIDLSKEGTTPDGL